jgi:hypothetical protein
MRDPAVPGDLPITPARASFAADDGPYGFHLVRAATPQAVLSVRAAGEKKRVVTIAGVNIAFDILGVGTRH